MFDLKAENNEEGLVVSRIQEYLRGDGELFLPNISGRHSKKMRMVSLAVNTLNEGIDRVVERIRKEHSITCREGCDACCYGVIDGSIPEAILIQSYLDQNPKIKKKFQVNYTEWRKRVNMQKILNALQSLHQANDNERQQMLENLRKTYGRVPCPYLEASRCIIYPVRPIICRNYLSEANPKLCETGVTLVLQDAELKEIVYKGHNIIIQLCSFIDMIGIVDHPMPLFVHDLINDPKGGQIYIQKCAKRCNEMAYRLRAR